MNRNPERPPFNVQCPTCLVKSGEACRTRATRRVTDIHSARWVRAMNRLAS